MCYYEVEPALTNLYVITYSSGSDTFSGRFKKHRFLNRPAHNWTPMIPKMKNTKKHNNNTFPNIGNVSRRSITKIRMPAMEYNV